MESTVYYELGPDDQEYQVEAVFEKFVQGRYSGPPDQCYPDEGGGIEEILAYKVLNVPEAERDYPWRTKKLEKVYAEEVFYLLAMEKGISVEAAEEMVEEDLIAAAEYTDDCEGPEEPWDADY